MIKFLHSFYYFLKHLFIIKEVDVLFYYPQHFNRGVQDENLFFEPFYQSCKLNNKSYLIFEEIDRNSNKNRNNDVIPFDFIYYFIIVLRKLKLSEKSIGKVLKKSLLRSIRYKNLIVLSQSMIEIFRYVNKESNIFDLQHGIIHSAMESYCQGNKANKRIRENNIQLLLFGEGFKNILERIDSTNYYKDNAHVIGVKKESLKLNTDIVNKNVLVTLQFTEDHTPSQNEKLYNDFIEFIYDNTEYTFYLRNHPRFNIEVDVENLYQIKNTKQAPSQLSECFSICSFHLTSYSTTTFECASVGIPTVFLTSLKEDFRMFNNDFHYPLNKNLDDIYDNYPEYSEKVIQWESEYYSSFDEEKFISLLK
ncbi:MAG: hypothetical protein CMD22_04295 [Flavobacteriales bacterium]|nr:hypothetical protein [Flavobacteriales bacterium]|tara:strand:- start:815 stop:1906 length:1092 start_codon:yes stop_codon:yes gene_type:complete